MTHSKIIDPLIEERLDLIDQQLMKNGWYGLVYGSRFRCRWEIDKAIKDRKKTKADLGQYKYVSISEIKNESLWANRN